MLPFKLIGEVPWPRSSICEDRRHKTTCEEGRDRQAGDKPCCSRGTLTEPVLRGVAVTTALKTENNVQVSFPPIPHSCEDLPPHPPFLFRPSSPSPILVKTFLPYLPFLWRPSRNDFLMTTCQAGQPAAPVSWRSGVYRSCLKWFSSMLLKISILLRLLNEL